MKGECLCRRVAITMSGRPEWMNACNCALCWKLGTLWAYLPGAEVAVTGETGRYRREDVAQNHIDAHFCARCGTTTHWTPIDPDGDRVGINMRLFDPADLIGVEVRYEDGRHDPGPDKRHYRPATTFDGAGA